MKVSELIEQKIIACILENFKLINELFIDDKCFLNITNRKIILFLKTIYREERPEKVDYGKLALKFPTQKQQNNFLNYCAELLVLDYLPFEFYSYQETLQENYRKVQIDNLVKKYDKQELTQENLIDELINIKNENLYISKKNMKKTPEEMLSTIRDKERFITFDRFNTFNTKFKLKENTVNVIAARPSEGKSALAINLMCDLMKRYKCLYFNMEMTESEIYERMIGIEGNLKIDDIRVPQTEYQENFIKETAQKIYNGKYEIVHGSKNIASIRSKIIREQRDEHLIVFIDYIGYVTAKYGMSDKDRIGEITRELNNLTKDCDCTIFIIAQINRNGADKPTMNDLKDSGELEQSADTIILINDPNKQSNDLIKDIELLIPKCRGSKRNMFINAKYYKEKQRMEI